MPVRMQSPPPHLRNTQCTQPLHRPAKLGVVHCFSVATLHGCVRNKANYMFNHRTDTKIKDAGNSNSTSHIRQLYCNNLKLLGATCKPCQRETDTKYEGHHEETYAWADAISLNVFPFSNTLWHASLRTRAKRALFQGSLHLVTNA
jgi:hypothetical protein